MVDFNFVFVQFKIFITVTAGYIYIYGNNGYIFSEKRAYFFFVTRFCPEQQF